MRGTGDVMELLAGESQDDLAPPSQNQMQQFYDAFQTLDTQLRCVCVREGISMPC